MKLSLNKVLSRKNLNLAVGLIALMVFLWLISYAIPNLFVQMFDTGLGNLILLGIVGLASMANINLGVGLLIMFFILYRFAHMSGRRFEGFDTLDMDIMKKGLEGDSSPSTIDYMINKKNIKYSDNQINAMTKEQLIKARDSIKVRITGNRMVGILNPNSKVTANETLNKINNKLNTMP